MSKSEKCLVCYVALAMAYLAVHAVIWAIR